MIRPIGKKILIRKEKSPDKKGLIYLPTPKENGGSVPPFAGVIVSMGSKCGDDFEVGMRVTYHWAAAIDLEYEDVLYVLVPEEKISGIIDKNVVLG